MRPPPPPPDDDVFDDDPTIFDDEPTHHDDRPPLDEAVPEPTTPRPEREPAPARETTGKIQTLTGYELVQTELRIAQARADERLFVLVGLRMMAIASGSNAAAADDVMRKFASWITRPENIRVIRAAMGKTPEPA